MKDAIITVLAGFLAVGLLFGFTVRSFGIESQYKNAGNLLFYALCAIIVFLGLSWLFS